jgi:DNA-binding NarL/FixJ family response regulator
VSTIPKEADKTVNVVVVDDHVALRRGMELLLRREGYHVVGTADDAEQAEQLILRRRPEPELRIILYTGSADEEELLDGLRAGAAGFALKSGDPNELKAAIRTVAEGGDYIDPRLTPLLRRAAPGRKLLSPREREILELLAHGLSGEDAAKQLYLSSETVRTHVRNAMAKLDASTRVHAVALAMQRGEISA